MGGAGARRGTRTSGRPDIAPLACTTRSTAAVSADTESRSTDRVRTGGLEHCGLHLRAPHLRQRGTGLRASLAGRARQTMIYTHVLNRGGRGVRSPADML